MKELVAQRDEFVKKYNDEVKDRNDIVTSTTTWSHRWQNLQRGKQ